MLEVIYRIYQVADEETQRENSKYVFIGSLNTELTMDCKICDRANNICTCF